MSKRSHDSTSQLQLQPLRDLARNFDLDIEPYLQEYLCAEDRLAANDSNDDKHTQFASAALAIQNSTGIYTRKVDFLHQKVYEAQEALHEFLPATTKTRRAKGNYDDEDEFRSYDPHMEFLLMDDVLPVDRNGRRIDLPSVRRRTSDENDITTTLPDNNTTIVDNNDTTTQQQHNVTLLSLGGILSTSQTTFISRHVASNTSPAAMSRVLLQNLNSTKWRLHSDVEGVSGALVMPGAKKGVFVNGEVWSPREASAMENAAVGEEMQIFGREPHLEAVDDGSFCEDGGGGFELNDEYMPDTDAHEPEVEVNGQEPNPEVDARERKPETKKTKPPVQDPWETLDPHESSHEKPKPLKIGVTYILPPGIDDVPSKSVTGSRTKHVKPTTKAAAAVDTVNWTKSPFVVDPLLFDGNVMDWMNPKQMIYGDEFTYLAKRYAKHFKAMARQTKRMEQEGGNDHAIVDEYHEEDDGYGSGFDCGGDDDDYSYNDIKEEQVHRSNVDFATIDDVFHYQDDEDDDENRDHMTFEELCRAHLRKFAKTAEIYAAETQLAKRVGAWQSGLAPLLEEQEKRPEFDIHSMGREILSRVEDGVYDTKKRSVTGEKKLDGKGNGRGNIVGFRQLSKDKEEYEVCRLFLSTLMLCNCGNVVVHDRNDVGSTESLQIELLNAKFEAVMEEFLAPSVAENRREGMTQDDVHAGI